MASSLNRSLFIFVTKILAVPAFPIPPGSGSREAGKSRQPFLSRLQPGYSRGVPADIRHTARHTASAVQLGRNYIFPQSRPLPSAGGVSVQVLPPDTPRTSQAWAQHIWADSVPVSPRKHEAGCPQSVRCPDQRIRRQPPQFPERFLPRLPQQSGCQSGLQQNQTPDRFPYKPAKCGKSLRRTPEKQDPAQYVSGRRTTPQIFSVVAAPTRQ